MSKEWAHWAAEQLRTAHTKGPDIAGPTERTAAPDADTWSAGDANEQAHSGR
ncbi:hypothetical protein [Streptomyces sp. NPDC101455]|uniref:hypothetical protein n=1 Tax=Streptomyces sp. NPDC101455 TaxID=3366142 RepID=UPI00380BF3DE